MKIQFASEEMMNEYLMTNSLTDHNRMVVQRFGMNPFEVIEDDLAGCVWWDVIGSDGGIDFTFSPSDRCFFVYVEE